MITYYPLTLGDVEGVGGGGGRRHSNTATIGLVFHAAGEYGVASVPRLLGGGVVGYEA